MKSFDIACKITLFPTNVKGFLDNLWLFFDNIRYALADFYGDGLCRELILSLTIQASLFIDFLGSKMKLPML